LTSKIKNPYVVLVATIYLTRTKDEITEKVVVDFIKNIQQFLTYTRQNSEELRNTIRKVGFYNNKAKILIRLAKVLVEEYKGKVPSSIEELLKLPGVGRKTANCVLVYAYDIPAIPVDTHVHRIFNRLGDS